MLLLTHWKLDIEIATWKKQKQNNQKKNRNVYQWARPIYSANKQIHPRHLSVAS